MMPISKQEKMLILEIREKTDKNINVIISKNTKTGDYYIKEISNPKRVLPD